ncbi:MAG: hypothetical protein KAI81_05080, partial [Candidatus Marinimicrobia bacterium]|nr:hypothetical protein [Candidatus Neomarinimicrobiota bacterium]
DTSHQSNDTFLLQKFIKDYDIEHYYEFGRSGVPGIVLEESGFVVPGTVLISGEKGFNELGALGCYVIRNSSNEIALSWATGEQWIQVPNSILIDIKGEIGQWVSGTDIALHFLRNFELPLEDNYIFEVRGEGLASIPVYERLNFARVLFDFSGKPVLFETDQKVVEYLSDIAQKEAHYFYGDDDAKYLKKDVIDLNQVEPMLAVSSDCEEISYHSLSDFISENDEQGIDKIFMGASGSGHFEDIQLGIRTSKFKKIHKDVQTIIMPGSSTINSNLISEGLMGILLELNNEIYPASFFRTLAESIGIYTHNVHMLTTSSQLFLHAMETSGHNLYLGSIMTAFASGIKGTISHPASIHHEETMKQKNETDL